MGVPSDPLRVGTRGSALALAQTGQLCAALAERHPGLGIETVIIRTSGDRMTQGALAPVGGKGLFVKELEEALADRRIDCAVHSMKDMPAQLPAGLCIAASPEREDPRDAFLSHSAERLEELAPRARLGTASLRRQAQSLHHRPDLDIELLRGNVDTRLAKLDSCQVDAVLLAHAGLKRLGLGHLSRSLIDPVERPPAPGQGALAIETREDDCNLAWVRALRHEPTMIAVTAERGALTALEASCKTAVGAHAWLEGGVLKLVVEALTSDGRERFRHTGETEIAQLADPAASARDLGLSLGLAVRDAAGDALGT